MTILSRAFPASCVLVVLVACVAPPGESDASKAKATPNAHGQQPTAQALNSAFPPDPVFAGTPVSTATLPGNLVIEDFVIGEGEAARAGSEVSVHYRGTLADGTMFDTSRKRNRPFTFTIGEGRVIKGWDQGVPGMKVGGKRRLTVPAELGYGSRDKGKIPPNSQLTFEIELVASVPPLPPLPPPKGDEAFAGEPIERLELDGGLIAEDFAKGEGRVAKTGDKVMVHYTGKLEDGTVFDSSIPRKKAIGFVLGTGRVIKGWDQGIEGMMVGGLRRLTIPAELAYGPRSKGKIPANSQLTFTIELMAVRDAPKTPPRRLPPKKGR